MAGSESRPTPSTGQSNAETSKGSSARSDQDTITITEVLATAFTALPAGSILVHSTNCIGSWGPVVAAQLRKDFPGAYQVYRSFCNEHKTPNARWPTTSEMVGRCLMIPPQDSDTALGRPRIFIACLLTSAGYGRFSDKTGKPGKDDSETILEQTALALQDLHGQVAQLSQQDVTIYSPKFNSGNFNIRWDLTLHLIEEVFEGWKGVWMVLCQE